MLPSKKGNTRARRRKCSSNGVDRQGKTRALTLDLLLTYSHMGMYYYLMPRLATTSDAYNAVAEPCRRKILDYLALQERPVGDIVSTLELEQPSVSKHLRVLREVGLVEVRRDGRRMLYRINVEGLRPLHEWTSTFERFWRHQLHRIKERAERGGDPPETESGLPIKEES
jgi:DNA-binding transcriptional ArsR family regulator